MPRDRIKTASRESIVTLNMVIGAIEFHHAQIQKLEKDFPELAGLSMMLNDLITRYKSDKIIDIDLLVNKELLND